MRQIKFRGKRVDNGKWVYGNLVNCSDCIYIVYEAFADDYRWGFENVFIPIDPATVGQFTGLLDKNGKEIWEGDVAKRPSSNGTPEQMAIGSVIFNKGSFIFHRVNTNIRISVDNIIFHYADMEVIGNLHDNPLLLTNK